MNIIKNFTNLWAESSYVTPLGEGLNPRLEYPSPSGIFVVDKLLFSLQYIITTHTSHTLHRTIQIVKAIKFRIG